MLRSKQVLPLCKGARSVLVPGVKNKSVDGSPICSEEDSRASNNHPSSQTKYTSQRHHHLPSKFTGKDDILGSSFATNNYRQVLYHAAVEPTVPGSTGTVRQETQRRPKARNASMPASSQERTVSHNSLPGGFKAVDQISGSVGSQETKRYNKKESFKNSNNFQQKQKSSQAYPESYIPGSTARIQSDRHGGCEYPNRYSGSQRPCSGYTESFVRSNSEATALKPDYLYGVKRPGNPSSCVNNPTLLNSRRYYCIPNEQTKHFVSQESHLLPDINGGDHLQYQITSVPPTGAVPLYHKESHNLQNNNVCSTGNVNGTTDASRPYTNENCPGNYGNNRGRTNKNQGGSKKKGNQGLYQQFPVSNNGNLVDYVSTILRQNRWGPATLEALKNLNVTLNVYQVNQILKLQQDPDLALNFFFWAKQQEGFRHDEHSYTTMIGILGNSRKFDAIDALLGEMINDGCWPTVVTYNRLIHSYGRANHIRKAVDVFHEMQAIGCMPDRTTYGTLINIHAKAGYLDQALRMYSEMQEAGLSPDSFVYSVMINCLGKSGDLSAAYKLFCEMTERGCVPTLVTYNNMIDLHAKARKYTIALKLYQDMQNAGFQPDKYTFNVVMEVHKYCGRYEEAESIFNEMQKAGWMPDEVVYGVLVDMWGKAGNVQRAFQWFSSMLHSGIRPNVPTCNSLLGAFLRANMFNEALMILQEMLQMNLCPSLQTYTLLISSCTTNGAHQDMYLFSTLMANTGHPAHSFLISLPTAEPGGQNIMNHAAGFFDLIHSEDRESKRGFTDAVVNFLYSSDLKEEAGFVWEVAMERNLYPNAVTIKAPKYWSINLHVMSMGTALIALSRSLSSLREKMFMSGVEPDRIDIITGWGKRSRVMGSSLVKQSVEQMLSVFHSPFSLENGNSGCFVGFGRPLIEWMNASPLERMHLL